MGDLADRSLLCDISVISGWHSAFSLLSFPYSAGHRFNPQQVLSENVLIYKSQKEAEKWGEEAAAWSSAALSVCSASLQPLQKYLKVV
jgi:hypothetical protein